VARRDYYFDLLNAYRTGDVGPLIMTFAVSARIAASESQATARRLDEIRQEWRAMLKPRAGSAIAHLLGELPARPILSSEDALAVVDAPRSSVFAAISRLQDAGILRPLTERKRDQVWGAGPILDELEDLSVRIGRAAATPTVR
jgi:Fic family protein